MEYIGLMGVFLSPPILEQMLIAEIVFEKVHVYIHTYEVTWYEVT